MQFTTLLSLAVLAATASAQTDQPAPCYKLEQIVARGSTEPSPLGVNLGPALKSEVGAILGNDVLTVGLIYPATFDLPDSPQTGIRNLAARIKQRAAQCPDMKFALSGFSQGADVTHSVVTFQIPELQDRISSITVFGDPLQSIGWPPVFEGRVLSVCDPADRACGGRGTSGHTTYGKTTLHKRAVEFIVDRYRNGVPAGMPRDTRGTMKALPEPGDAANFLIPFVTWPPRDWARKYTDGYIAPVVSR